MTPDLESSISFFTPAIAFYANYIPSAVRTLHDQYYSTHEEDLPEQFRAPEWNDEQMDWHIEHLIRDANGELTYVRSDDQFGVTFKLESWTAVLENGESVERKVAVVGNPEGKAAAGSYRLVLSRTTGMETYTAELPFFVHYKVFAPASEQIGGVLQ